MGRQRIDVIIPNTVIKSVRKSLNFSYDDYGVMVKLYNEGKTNKEIAGIMGRTVASIDAHLYRLRQELRKIERFGQPVANTSISRLQKYMKSSNTGCKYHADCDTCPFPACVFDGFDPSYIPPKKTKLEKRWTPTDIQHWNELEHLPTPLSDETLANIFHTSVPTIEAFKRKRRHHDTV